MSDKMTGAELKVQLTGLGLQPQWFADRLKVTKRTIIRWFDLDQVPSEAVDEINRIRTITANEMSRALYAMGNTGVIHTHRTGDLQFQGVQRLNTFPASWHRALAFRVLDSIRTQGVDATVAYLDPKGQS